MNAYKAVLAATEHQTLTGDVNGDNRADMILSRNINEKRALTVFMGKTDGSFTEPVTTNSTRTFVYSDPAFAGDFNGDGRDDFIVRWKSYDGRVCFLTYPGTASGGFSAAVRTEPNANIPYYSYSCRYKIISRFAGKCLNIYGDNLTSLSNNRNVCIWTDSGSNEQKWTIQTIGTGVYIQAYIDHAFGLNVYRSGDPWNCDIHTISNNETDAKVDIIETTGGYYIKLHNYNMYLTVTSSQDGGNVCWDDYTGGPLQIWSIVPA